MAWITIPAFVDGPLDASDLQPLADDLNAFIVVTSVLDFPSVAAGGTQDLTVTVSGAAVLDPVEVNTNPLGLSAGIVLSAGVSAANTVTVRATNVTASAIDPGAVTVIVSVRRQN